MGREVLHWSPNSLTVLRTIYTGFPVRQMAFDYFPVDQVVYMGIAGAVNPKWQPGDVIVPERWYYHDESVYSNPKPKNDGEYILPEFHNL